MADKLRGGSTVAGNLILHLGNVKDHSVLPNSGVTAGTHTKVTVDSQGRVVQATNLAAADVPTLPISKITDLASTLDSKVDKTAYTATDVLAKLKTVDGANSGLDADTLDGKELATIESDYKAYTDDRLTNVALSTIIEANDSYTLDAKTLFSDHAAFDLRSIQVRALMLDTTTGSPTNGYLINSESSLTVGVREDGSIRVHNHRDETSIVYITISRPSAPL